MVEDENELQINKGYFEFWAGFDGEKLAIVVGIEEFPDEQGTIDLDKEDMRKLRDFLNKFID